MDTHTGRNNGDAAQGDSWISKRGSRTHAWSRTRTHSDTGFQLNSISPMGRKVKELHGEESERLVGVLTNCWSVCKTKRLRERVWGEVSCKDHENKRERLERLGQKLKTGAGTQIGVPICFTEYPQLSSLAAELWTPCCPLPDWSGRRKPFVQGWTHTSRRLRRFFKTPPTVEPVDENLLPRGGHTHRAVFGAVKVVVRPGASSSVLTPRGTFVQKAPNCWRNEELVDT